MTPLRQLEAQIDAGAARLFKPRDTVRFRVYGRPLASSKTHLNYKMTGPLTVAFRRVETPSGGTEELFADAGRNPPDGVIVHYWLPQPAPESVKVSILDADGQEVRSYSNKVEGATGNGPWAPNQAGMNRLVWDYRYAGPTKLDAKSRSAREEAAEGGSGPRAVPGRYMVQLTIPAAEAPTSDQTSGGEQTLFHEFALLADPRLSLSLEDLKAQVRLQLAIRDRSSETHALVNQIRRVAGQVQAWVERAGAEHEEVKTSGQALLDELKAVEGELINLDFEKPRPGLNRLKEKWDALAAMVDESDDAPTRGAQDVFDQLSAQLAAERRTFGEIEKGALKTFNELIASLKLPPVAT